MAPPRNVVKIAVQMRDAIPQLIQLDQAKPLAAVLKEVCDAWSLLHSERYALQFADGHRRYITENNRMEIKNGSILCLSTAPDLEAERLLGGLQSESREGRREALRHLVLLAPDMTFAQEVISRDGLQRLGTIIEDGDDLGEVLALALRAFLELMEHGVVSWETLSIPFVRKVVCYVNMNLMDASVQPLALGLLESVTLSSPALGQLVKSEVPLDRLLVHLQVMNQQLQTKAMALLTALLQGASPAERKHMLDYLWQRNLRQFIYKNIIHSAAPLGDEMAHHLYILQALTLGLLEPRMRMPLDPYSQEQREQLQALRQAAFEPEGEPLGAGLSADRRRSLCAREFRKLGFSNSNPAQDLERVPPGLLALDNMLYFSRHAPSAYSRFVLENSSREDKHECPFARSSIQLTVLLCELLRVGEPCSETAQDFSPMFFSQDQSFHELFCVSIQLLNKTWKEMRATQEDFDKVMQVVREQLARTLALKPSSLELFRTKVNTLTYGEVLRLRQTERLHQEGTLAPPILELREKLKPELMGLIRQQRLLRLCEGTLFRKISSRRRQGHYVGRGGRGRLGWGQGVSLSSLLTSAPFCPQTSCGSAACPPTTRCCSMGMWRRVLAPRSRRACLSSVRRAGWGSDTCFPQTTPCSGTAWGPSGQPNHLPAVPVADIRALLTGKDCPHVREKGSGKQNKDFCELAFSISYDHGEEEAYLNFIAPSKRENIIKREPPERQKRCLVCTPARYLSTESSQEDTWNSFPGGENLAWLLQREKQLLTAVMTGRSMCLQVKSFLSTVWIQACTD